MVRRLKQCSIDGCTREHEAKGMCKAHYLRERYWPGAVGPIRGYGRKCCSADGCRRKHYARGLCRWHWEVSRRGAT